jgi:hypothetical protein
VVKGTGLDLALAVLPLDPLVGGLGEGQAGGLDRETVFDGAGGPVAQHHVVGEALTERGDDEVAASTASG